MSATPAFRTMASMTVDQPEAVLAPILHSYLYDATYPDFSLYFPKRKSARPPDGYFHPSTHPLLTERQLYFYMQGKDFHIEPLEYMGALNTTMGTAIHGFIQMCLWDASVLVKPPDGTCVSCGRPHSATPVMTRGKCNEHPLLHEETKTRGHMDGLLNIPGWGIGGLEFKTSNMTKVQNWDGSLDQFRVKWPAYYAQVQDYMRCTGLRRVIVLFLGMGHPWTIRECVIEYDEVFAFAIERKYRNVLRHIELGTVPEPCCQPRSKATVECPALACPVKRL